MKEYFIYTDNMAVGYGGRPLIKNIEIRLNRGEILTLIGPNGAGKSTILKSMTRQLSLIGGTVYLDRKSMENMSNKEVARRLSVVMTERIEPELMTCRDVVATGRYPYTGRLGILDERDRQKIREAMEMVHALELEECSFTEISDGQRQRILLARAICQEPEVIVLDEPTSFLDVRHKLELLAILKELVRERQVAVLMSLHELELAQKISDYIVCVREHAIGRCGTPEEIFDSGYISELYGITRGSYEAPLGVLELEPVRGQPQVFVVGGNGSGIPVYRRLWREGIPFAAGVLHENDVEYPVARALAVEVVTERAFYPVSDEALKRAQALAESCGRVICAVKEFGPMNDRNRELIDRFSSRSSPVPAEA